MNNIKYLSLRSITQSIQSEFTKLIFRISTPAFTQLFGDGVNGKKAMIRPEQFTITKDGNIGLSGIVKRVLFYGSYYMIEVLIDGLIIKIRTSAFQFYTGDKVLIGISS